MDYYNQTEKEIVQLYDSLNLALFFENLLMGKHHDLRNRSMHLDYQFIEKAKSASANDPKCNYCTLEEMALLRIIKDEPKITQKELAIRTGKSERTIKTNTMMLQEKGFLERKTENAMDTEGY